MKNKLKNALAVCGFSAVKAIEESKPEKISRLYFSAERASQFSSLCKFLASKKIPYNLVETKDLEKLCGSVHHQGVVAMIEQEEIPFLTKEISNEWLHNKEDAVLLDRVGNANNLGAIVRSAAFFGIKNIVIPSDEAQASVTTSSYRVAQGGMEFVKIYKVGDSATFLHSMEGKMLRVGTDARAKLTVDKIRENCRKKSNKAALIVLGNEENGLSKAVKNECDILVSIPSPVHLETPDSLNVAQASSIIFYAMMNE